MHINYHSARGNALLPRHYLYMRVLYLYMRVLYPYN